MGEYSGEGNAATCDVVKGNPQAGGSANLVGDSNGPEYASTSSVLCLNGPSLST